MIYEAITFEVIRSEHECIAGHVNSKRIFKSRKEKKKTGRKNCFSVP
jgi:hypothetical protein